MESFATGLYQHNDEETRLVFVEAVAKDSGGDRNVIFTEAFHPVEKHVMSEAAFNEVYHKVHKITVSA